MNYAFEYIYLSQLTEQLNSTTDQQAARHALSSADDLVKHFAATFHTSPDIFAPGALVLTPYQTDGLEYWLLQFPTPRREPEALWGVIVRYKDKPFKYYTCETAGDGQYMIGCTDTLHHVNYGSCEGDRDLFVAKILQFAQGTLNPLSCLLKDR